MKALLPALFGLAVLACSSGVSQTPAHPSEPAPNPIEPAPSGQLVTPAPFAAPIPAEPSPSSDPAARGPLEFPALSDPGLITLQSMSLIGEPNVQTLRVAEDGNWSFAKGAEKRAGKLSAKQLETVRGLLNEVSSAKPSEGMGLPCDALPMHAARLSFGGSRSIGWAWPCAGPRPAEPVIQMAKVLWKIGQGRSEAEIERALLQR
jgi:hypothetical protein